MTTDRATDSQYEPTLSDLSAIVRQGFEQMHQSFAQVYESLQELRERMVRVESKVEDMDETLQAVSRAVDKDAETLINHEGFILALETAH